MSQIEDPEFVNLLYKNDDKAFIDLYYTVAPKMFWFVKKQLYNFRSQFDIEEASKDIVSTTFERVINNIRQYNRSKSKLVTWIFNIANNCATDYKRGWYRQKELDRRNIEKITSSNSTHIESSLDKINHKELEVAISQLNGKDKAYLELFFVEQYTDEIIGEMVGVSPGAVRTARCRLLKKLSNLLLKTYVLQP